MRFLLLCFTVATAFAQKTVVVRPVEVDEVLVNPEMGIQTFQRINGDPINSGSRWSEDGPLTLPEPAQSKPDFPESSIAYYRWFWSQIEPERGKYVWDGIDLALERAHGKKQKVDFRLMPYDQAHPLPEWYRNSGARRANKPEDSDGKIWSPDADDPLYAKYWGAFTTAAGKRYNGHPDIECD